RDRAGDVPPLLRNLRHADRFARALPAPVRLPADIPRDRVADLNEEVRLGAMEAQAVVEVLLHQFDDSRDRLRRLFRIGLELDRPFDRFEHDDRPGARRLLLRPRDGRERDDGAGEYQCRKLLEHAFYLLPSTFYLLPSTFYL